MSKCPRCGARLMRMRRMARKLGLWRAWVCSSLKCNYTASKKYIFSRRNEL